MVKQNLPPFNRYNILYPQAEMFPIQYPQISEDFKDCHKSFDRDMTGQVNGLGAPLADP